MPDILLTLRTSPDGGQDTGRLKCVLKAILRQHGLTCIDIRDAPPMEQLTKDSLTDMKNSSAPCPAGTEPRNRRRRNRSPYAT